MLCPNCGRELIDGETCVCQNEQSQQAYYEPTPDSQQAYYQPPTNTNPMYYAPSVQQARTDYPEGYNIKKKYVAVILGACLGMLGIHHFYLGNTTKGIIQILLSTIGALVAIGPLVSMVWAIVETVNLLTEKTNADANGFKIQTFAEELNSTK